MNSPVELKDTSRYPRERIGNEADGTGEPECTQARYPSDAGCRQAKGNHYREILKKTA